MLVGPAYHIVVILVPEKRIRAKFINLIIVPEDLLFIPVILGVLKGDLFSAVDCFVYDVNVIEVLCIVRLDAISGMYVPDELRTLVL